MAKTKIESKPNRIYEIPFQRIGRVALDEDQKKVRIEKYGKKLKRQKHGAAASQRQKYRMPKSLADLRAEAFSQASKPTSAELDLAATQLLAENGLGNDGQGLSGDWHSEDYDGTEELAQQLAMEATIELMGAQSDLDEEIRSARHALRKEERENASLEPGHDDDKQDYVLDGINIKNGRPNQ
jgi:hypothetical protein